MALKIISINANGMGNHIKRRALFNFARDRADVICVQETHSTSELESQQKLEWGGEIFYSHESNMPKEWQS